MTHLQLTELEKDLFDNDPEMKNRNLEKDMLEVLHSLIRMIDEDLDEENTNPGDVQGFSDGIFLLELRFNQYKYKYGLKGSFEE